MLEYIIVILYLLFIISSSAIVIRVSLFTFCYMHEMKIISKQEYLKYLEYKKQQEPESSKKYYTL